MIQALIDGETDPARLAELAHRRIRTSPETLREALRGRRGAKKAIGAVAASMLTTAYHMLKDGTFYHDLGADHFDRRAKGAATNRLIAKLKSLGYDVQITPSAT